VTPPVDGLLAAIERDIGDALDRCYQKLQQLEARITAQRWPAVIAKYRAARDRIAAEHRQRRWEGDS